ncbi:aldo/keto reductase [Pseudorhodoferax sp.]|uniref:aldo/keto reductase n=1 Tax=Pseudorhodoferax sp. TaxID=1993553 RepID=UPI0039E60D39
MRTVPLGRSGLKATELCLGTMTFGEQVDAASAHAILDRSLDLGIGFIDTAEMYAVPARAETYGATETILGDWFAARPGARQRVLLATKAAGPPRGMPWIRHGRPDFKASDIVESCEASLKRLRTDVIDLYQIHWPARNVPSFGERYYDPAKERPAPSVEEQLHALDSLVRAGKVRAIGLSNETPWGVHEFVRLAEAHSLPRVATVQNAYCLINRSVENALDETLHRLDVALLAYSPLGFGLLTGKYDAGGTSGPQAPAQARIARYASVRSGRWGRPAALEAARRYSALAREHGLTPTQLALAFCRSKWQVASTILGVTSVAQLEEDVAAYATALPEGVPAALDELRLELGDPAI